MDLPLFLFQEILLSIRPSHDCAHFHTIFFLKCCRPFSDSKVTSFWYSRTISVSILHNWHNFPRKKQPEIVSASPLLRICGRSITCLAATEFCCCQVKLYFTLIIQITKIYYNFLENRSVSNRFQVGYMPEFILNNRLLLTQLTVQMHSLA